MSLIKDLKSSSSHLRITKECLFNIAVYIGTVMVLGIEVRDYSAGVMVEGNYS
jgi:hypothetical protein